MRDAKTVVKEIRRRARAGMPLNSGANRGDWLYASAVKYLGSWKAAVEAAGFDYEQVRWRPEADMAEAEVKAELKRLAASGEQLLAANHPKLSRAARLHFGSWRGALAAAGLPEAHRFWTRQRIVKELRERQRAGKALTTKGVLRDDRSLHDAIYRRFDSWNHALVTAKVKKKRR